MLRTRVKAGPLAGLVLSLVAAVVFTLVQAGELLVPALTPEFGQRAPTTIRVPYGARVVRDISVGRVEFHYETHRVVVPAGTLLAGGNEEHRAAVKFESLRRPPRWHGLLGLFVIYFTLSMTLTAYLRKFGQARLRLLRSQIGVIAAGALFVVATKLLLLLTSLPDFWLPIAVVPLWVSTGYDRRTAFVVTVVLSLVVASMVRFDLLLLMVMLAQGMAATLMYVDRKHPRHMVIAGVLAGFSTAMLYVAMVVTMEGRVDIVADLARGAESRLIACFLGGVSAGFIAAVLRAPVLRLLGHVPRERLLDLTDLEQPLLKKMSREAPGSWEHSRAMANLAEGAASAIGADALLTRVGAYYHDLGKTAQPKYFVENLGPEEESPHDELEPDVSADAIMAHVVVGTKILRDGSVPEPVVEFAYTHHGTQIVEYFYNKCIEQGNPKNLTEDDFRYPGMRPQTKETAILMLVDSIEAASRTIDPPDREAFEIMIQRIVFTKLKSGQLDESGLTVEDLRTLINRMADTLVNMHHHRIKYQWQAKQAEQFGVPSQVVAPTSAPRVEVHQSVLPRPSVPTLDWSEETAPSQPLRSDEKSATADAPLPADEAVGQPARSAAPANEAVGQPACSAAPANEAVGQPARSAAPATEPVDATADASQRSTGEERESDSPPTEATPALPEAAGRGERG